MKLKFNEIIESLPPEWPQNLYGWIENLNQQLKTITIILDDDPTGNQTVHDIPILTDWNTETIKNELTNNSPVFFILTNSRSFSSSKTISIHREICSNITEANRDLNKRLRIISRCDSTLRGHYAEEVNTLNEFIYSNEAVQVFVPAFFQGKRYTINDIHYVNEGDHLIPVAETAYAKDNVFKFSNSNLKEYVVEKTRGQIKIDEILSISIDMIRIKGPKTINEIIINKRKCRAIIVNAVSDEDLKVIALAFLLLEKRGLKFIYRSAASLIPAIIPQKKIDLLQTEQLNLNSNNGGLIVVGSYVPKTNAQLNFLINNSNIIPLEINVDKLLATDENDFISEVVSTLENHILSGRSVVLFTSRKVISGDNPNESLSIIAKVSNSIVSIMGRINCKLRFIITKGGITSSDIAIKAFGLRKAVVLGQILPGVPVWKFIESKLNRDQNYIVFPGNVGEGEDLLKLYLQLSKE